MTTRLKRKASRRRKTSSGPSSKTSSKPSSTGPKKIKRKPAKPSKLKARGPRKQKLTAPVTPPNVSTLEAAMKMTPKAKWPPLEMMAEVPILIWGQKIDPSLTTLPKMIKKLQKAKVEIQKLEKTSREIKAAHLAGDQAKMDKLINQLSTKFPSSLANMNKDSPKEPYYGAHNLEVSSDPLYKKLTQLVKQHYKQAGMRRENLMSVPLDQIVARYSSQGGLVFIGTREEFDKHWSMELVDQLAEGLTVSNVVFMTLPWGDVKEYMYKSANGWLVDERQWVRDVGKLIYQYKKQEAKNG